MKSFLHLAPKSGFLKNTPQNNKKIYQNIEKIFPEVSILSSESNETSEGIGFKMETSYSFELFQKNHREFDRTWSALLSFMHVHEGKENNYQWFTEAQINKKNKLHKNSFDEIHRNLINFLNQYPNNYDSLAWSILFNDLGKYSVIKKIIHDKKENHDEILSKILQCKPHLFKGFSSLANHQQVNIIKGFGSKCDIAQFVQLERPVITLNGIKALSSEARILYFLHSVFDVAGASGDRYTKGSFVMDELVWTGFKLAYDALEGFDKGKTALEVYYDYVQSKGNLLGIGFKTEEDIAKIRLAAISRFYGKADGELICRVWDSLDIEDRQILTKELNVTGLDGKTPILIGYAPALVANFLAKTTNSLDDKFISLIKAYSHISASYKISRLNLGHSNPKFQVYVGDIHSIAKEITFSDYPQNMPLQISPAEYGSDISFDRNIFFTKENDVKPSQPKEYLDSKIENLTQTYYQFRDVLRLPNCFTQEREFSCHAKVLEELFNPVMKLPLEKWQQYLDYLSKLSVNSNCKFPNFIQQINESSLDTKLIFLAAGQASGKSTLYDNLVKSEFINEANTVVIRTRTFFNHLFQQGTYMDREKGWTSIIKEMQHLITLATKIALDNNISVVLDTHILTVQHCESIINSVKTAGCYSVMITPIVSLPTYYERVHIRASKSERLPNYEEHLVFHRVFSENWLEFRKLFDISIVVNNEIMSSKPNWDIIYIAQSVPSDNCEEKIFSQYEYCKFRSWSMIEPFDVSRFIEENSDPDRIEFMKRNLTDIYSSLMLKVKKDLSGPYQHCPVCPKLLDFIAVPGFHKLINVNESRSTNDICKNEKFFKR